jgi:hypothetical protein
VSILRKAQGVEIVENIIQTILSQNDVSLKSVHKNIFEV